MATWIKLTVAEPLPAVCHVDLEGCRLDPANHRAGAAHPGPFYAAGSSWYYPTEVSELAERIAETHRALGYTVTLTQA